MDGFENYSEQRMVFDDVGKTDDVGMDNDDNSNDDDDHSLSESLDGQSSTIRANSEQTPPVKLIINLGPNYFN
jgi:hypothetical protein